MRHRKANPPGPRRALSLGLVCLAMPFLPCSAVASSELLRTFPPGEVLRFQPRTAEEATQLPEGSRHPRDRATRTALDPSAHASAIVGEWSEWGPPVRTRHRMLFDSRRRELLVVGGDRGEDPQSTLWSFGLASGRWERRAALPPTADRSPLVIGAAIDSATDQILVARFVQVEGTSRSRIELLFGALGSSGAWRTVLVPGERLGRWNAGMALDLVRRQALLPGLWAPTADRHELLRVPLDAPESSALEPMLGSSPAATYRGACAFDELRDRLVILMPSNAQVTWSHVAAAGPFEWQALATPPLPFCGQPESLLRDAVGDAFLVNDDHGAACRMPGSGAAAQVLASECTTRRRDAAYALDPATRTLWRHGGRDLLDAHTLMQSLDVNAPAGWKSGTPEHMGSRLWHSSVVDRESGRLFVFGGWVSGTVPALVMSRSLDGEGGWTPFAEASPVRPRVRFLHSLVLDPVRRQLLVFGGQATDGSGLLLGDLWRLPLAPGGVWERIEMPGPSPRRLCSLWHDPAQDRFLLVGGDDLAKPLAEVWELRLGAAPAWRMLGTRGDLGPPQSGVWPDPVRGDAWVVRQDLLLHHLTFTVDSAFGEALELEPDALRPVVPYGFDAARREILAFARDDAGRMECATPLAMAPEVARRWTERTLSHEAPGGRVAAALALDPLADRVLLVGGYDDDARYFADTWALQWQAPVAATAALAHAQASAQGTRLEWRMSGATSVRATVERSADGVAWLELGAARAASADVLVFDDAPLEPGERAAYRLRIGSGATPTLSEIAWLERAAAPAALALAAAQNPSTGPMRVRLALAGSAPATLTLFDLSGRALERVDLAAGAREWSFGAPRTPGVYLARLSQGGVHRMVKLAASR